MPKPAPTILLLGYASAQGSPHNQTYRSGTLRPTWRKHLEDTELATSLVCHYHLVLSFVSLQYSIPLDLPSIPGMRKYVSIIKLCASVSGLYQLISAAMKLDK